MLEFELLAPDPCALFYCPLDCIPRHALLARLLDHRRKARIAREITAPHLRGHHDFFHEFADGLAFFQASHFPLGVQPLTTHAPSYPAGEPVASRAARLDLGMGVRRADAIGQGDCLTTHGRRSVTIAVTPKAML